LRSEEVTTYRARIVALLERLDEEGRRTLLEYAEFLVTRADPAPPPERPAARPASETVLQAVRRLNRSYPALRRAALMQPVGELLSQHLVDARPAREVIDELEALYASRHAERAGRA
jgi:hypothetical protein